MFKQVLTLINCFKLQKIILSLTQYSKNGANIKIFYNVTVYYGTPN